MNTIPPCSNTEQIYIKYNYKFSLFEQRFLRNSSASSIIRTNFFFSFRSLVCLSNVFFFISFLVNDSIKSLHFYCQFFQTNFPTFSQWKTLLVMIKSAGSCQLQELSWLHKSPLIGKNTSSNWIGLLITFTAIYFRAEIAPCLHEILNELFRWQDEAEKKILSQVTAGVADLYDVVISRANQNTNVAGALKDEYVRFTSDSFNRILVTLRIVAPSWELWRKGTPLQF